MYDYTVAQNLSNLIVNSLKKLSTLYYPVHILLKNLFDLQKELKAYCSYSLPTSGIVREIRLNLMPIHKKIVDRVSTYLYRGGVLVFALPLLLTAYSYTISLRSLSWSSRIALSKRYRLIYVSLFAAQAYQLSRRMLQRKTRNVNYY